METTVDNLMQHEEEDDDRRTLKRHEDQEQEQLQESDNDEEQQQQFQEMLESPLLQGTPLDDYYSRPHITSQVPLVVGGSDGSGTRAFVDVLSRLGVPMLVDDTGTMDIHASKLFDGKGWPPFAHLALKYGGSGNGHHTTTTTTTSANYKITDLPEVDQQKVEEELQTLKAQFDRRYKSLRSKAEANTNLTLVNSVLYGFKAPITMLLLPMLQAYLYPDTGFKYLHIVRDGRDIALSNNQSPVTKFYNATYPDAAARLEKYKNMAPVYGMQLWNDWNADLYDWVQSQLSNNKFDYLVMRTEDLMNPESKFEALTLLADFVGSRKTPLELCCISRKAVVDMGQSGVKTAGARATGRSIMMDYFDRKKIFMKDLAKSIGKASPTEMTAGERLNAMVKYRATRNQRTDNNGGGMLEERNQRFEDISGRVAARLGIRQRIHLNRVDLNQPQRNPENLMKQRYRGGGGGGGRRREKVDPAIRDLIGRRRRLMDEFTLEKHARTAGVDSVLEMRQQLGKRLLDPMMEANAKFKASHLGNFGPMQSEERHTHKKRPKPDGGDEQLGKLVASQLEVLKGDVIKQNVTDRYGKWASMLGSKPELSEAMHREGARALKVFGYQPPQRFMDRSKKHDFICDDTVVCPED
jgi:hypothetical protein